MTLVFMKFIILPQKKKKDYRILYQVVSFTRYTWIILYIRQQPILQDRISVNDKSSRYKNDKGTNEQDSQWQNERFNLYVDRIQKEFLTDEVIINCEGIKFVRKNKTSEFN